jgi:hypothetical protein
MNGRPLAWPSLRLLCVGAVGAGVVSLAFFPIYCVGAAVASLRGQTYQLYGAWELAIPFWPGMVVPYLSMFVLFLMPPLQLDEDELSELVRRLVTGSVVGGLVLFGAPSEVGFAERHDAGIWQPIYDVIYRLDGRVNAVPSFHVIYTTSILLLFIEVAAPALRVAYWVWLVLVCASTILTHRHNLVDVASGLALAICVSALSRRSFLARRLAIKGAAR